MKDARRQGKKDAQAGKPRFVPKWWLDREHYNEGYDEELARQAQFQAPDIPELHCYSCGLSKASIDRLKLIASGEFDGAAHAMSLAVEVLEELGAAS